MAGTWLSGKERGRPMQEIQVSEPLIWEEL